MHIEVLVEDRSGAKLMKIKAKSAYPKPDNVRVGLFE